MSRPAGVVRGVLREGLGVGPRPAPPRPPSRADRLFVCISGRNIGIILIGMNKISVSEAQKTLEEFADMLHRWSGRLAAIAEGVPAPVFEPGTDEPLNVAAGIHSLVTSALRDELPALRAIASTAATLEEKTMARRKRFPLREA